MSIDKFIIKINCTITVNSIRHFHSVPNLLYLLYLRKLYAKNSAILVRKQDISHTKRTSYVDHHTTINACSTMIYSSCLIFRQLFLMFANKFPFESFNPHNDLMEDLSSSSHRFFWDKLFASLVLNSWRRIDNRRYLV
jgi:hypothetical protein